MFKDIFDTYNWDEVKQSIYSKTKLDVEHALNKTSKRDLEDFKALISPAAASYLEPMAQLSHRLTQNVLGKQFRCMFHFIFPMNVKIFVPTVVLASTTR